jgi:hypothetical protein
VAKLKKKEKPTSTAIVKATPITVKPTYIRKRPKFIFLEVSETTHTNLKIRASASRRSIKKYILALIAADGITVEEPPRKNARLVFGQ